MSYYDGLWISLEFPFVENNVCEVFNGHLVWFIHQLFSVCCGVSRSSKYSRVGVYCSSSTNYLDCERVDFPTLLLEGL